MSMPRIVHCALGRHGLTTPFPLPRKVAIVLEELGLTYDTKFLDFAAGEHKAEAHTKYNPNGRIPTLIDHKNGDFVIW